MKIRKKITFLEVTSRPINYKFLKDFTNKRKKTYGTAVFSHTPLPNIPKETIETIDETFQQSEK